MANTPSRALPAAALANPDPWARVPRGQELAREVERGREQGAMWLLDDGVLPPPLLLSRALCVSARKGMEKLCRRLISLGASPGYCATEHASLHEELSTSGAYGEPVWACAFQAMRGGHGDLGAKLLASYGSDALGYRGATPFGYMELCQSSLRGAGKAKALGGVRALMEPKDWARTANALCMAGLIDDALDILEAASPIEQERVARAMAAPLCAYAPGDPSLEVAIIALERVVELGGGHLGQALAAWSLPDMCRLAKSGGYGSMGTNNRAAEIRAIMAVNWNWPSSRAEREGACWPRVAAMLSQNHAALTLLGDQPLAASELASMRAAAQMTVGVFEKTVAIESLPSLWRKNEMTGPGGGYSPTLPKGWDALGGARAALAFAESKEIGAVAKESSKRADKARRRELRDNPELAAAAATAALAAAEEPVKTRRRL